MIKAQNVIIIRISRMISINYCTVSVMLILPKTFCRYAVASDENKIFATVSNYGANSEAHNILRF